MEWVRIIFEDFTIILSDEVKKVKTFVNSDIAEIIVIDSVGEDVVEGVCFAIVYELDTVVIDE